MIKISRPLLRRILLFLAIFTSQSAFALNMMFPGNMQIITVITFLIIFLGTMVMNKVSILPGISLKIVSIVTINMILTFVSNRHFSGGYILVILGYVQACMFISVYDRQSFLEDYISCMKFFAVTGTIATLLTFNNWLGINHFFPILRNAVNDPYLNFIVAVPSIALANFRINSIWGEAGMFGVWLSLALIIELFMVQRSVNMKNVSILFLAAVLTLSATTLVVLVIIFFLYFSCKQISSSAHNHKKYFYFFCAFLASGIIISSFSNSAVDEVMSKFNSNSMELIGRLAPIKYNILKWAERPFFGNGLSLNIGESAQKLTFNGMNLNIRFNTTTTLILLNYFGIGMFLLHVALVYTFSKKFAKNRFRESVQAIIPLLISLAIMININTQAIELDQIFILLLMSSFMKDSVSDKEIKHN